MKRLLYILLLFLGGLGMFVEGKVLIRNCPGNIFSKTGEATFTLPTAVSVDTQGKTTDLTVNCTSPSEITLYKDYVTTVTCTATDLNKDSESCSFQIYLPDGFSCNRKNPSTQCVCSPFRPFFEPCSCIEGYSGLDCQVKDGGCRKGLKGAQCDIDYEAPVISCPADILTKSKQLTLQTQVTGSDNDGKQVNIICDPELSSTVEFKTDVMTSIRTVTCTGRDTFGNRADCSFQVVSDLEPPQMSACPGNIYTSSTTFDLILDIATDNTEPKPNVTCNLSPGDTLTTYVTDVVCDAMDEAGNNAKESCQFKIYLDGGNCFSGKPNCDIDSDGGYKCADGYSGLDCEVIDAIQCNSVGLNCICTDFNCTCRDGFKGQNCEIDYKPPELSNCPFGAIWSKDPVVTYRPMWTTDNSATNNLTVTCFPEERSEFYKYRTDVTCSVADSAGNKYSDCKFPVRRNSNSECTTDDGYCYKCGSGCRCFPGYYGPKCRDCDPCYNGGTRPDETNCQCECPMLHHGILCEQCFEPNKDYCLNGGTFVLTSCRCECLEDWTGRYCTLRHGEECPSDSTNAGCSCNGQNCTCLPEYQGPQCETCKPCMNGGSNQDPVNCNCTCPFNFGGALCTECVSIITCLNTGSFKDSMCSCMCTDSWSGFNCSTVVLNPIECPNDIYSQYDEGKKNAKVTWSDPVVNAGAVVACIPASGSEFEDGPKQVNCTATYGAETVECTFVVTVDNRAPLLDCPGNLKPYHHRWTSSSLVSWDSVKGDDEVSGTVEATCIPPSGTVFSGSTTVVCIAFDQAMNMDLCTFSVEIYNRGSSTLLIRDNTLWFPTTLSCARCKGNLKCRYLEDKDEYECYCPDGYTTKDDGICKDIDECSNKNNPCTIPKTKCKNTDGSYKCTCNDGFFSTGSTCREYPDTVYPDVPLDTPVGTYEKKISLEIAIADDSMFGCDPKKDSMSKECTILMNTFRQNVREEYMGFSPALLRIEVNQKSLTGGNIPHTVVYDYSRLTASQKARTAEKFYDDTMSSRVENEKMGGLKLVKDCKKCASPKDLTNICNGVPKPECEPGYVQQEVKSVGGTSCYVTCESLCTTNYCTEGTCVHQLPFEPRCRLPIVDPVAPTDGEPIEAELDLPLIIGCSVGGGGILLLIVGWILYFATSKRKETDETEDAEKYKDYKSDKNKGNYYNESFKMEEQ